MCSYSDLKERLTNVKSLVCDRSSCPFESAVGSKLSVIEGNILGLCLVLFIQISIYFILKGLT